MWSGTIGRARTPFEVVDGTVAAGYARVALTAEALARCDSQDLFRVREHCRERDVSVAVIDGVFDWLPIDPRRFRERPCDLDHVLQHVEVLGAESISAIAVADDMSIDAIAERFAPLCARLAGAGCAVMIEFTPLSAVPDLARAHELLVTTAHPAAGIVFDTWHFFRGTPDLHLLAALPRGEIAAVQIADAAAEPTGSLLADTLHHRLHPGDGDLELASAVRVLHDIGAMRAYGPEVLSTEQNARSPADAGAYAARRLDEFLAEVLG
jgi:sugar phosphate isomerase/epimerase